LKTTSEYSIVQCISADLKHNTQLSNKITEKYGNMSFILENLELIPGEITTINTEHRTIHYLITKDKYDSPISYLDLYENLYNLKCASISKTNITDKQLEWESIKSMIFEIFDKSKINILISNFDNEHENKNINISQSIKNIHNYTKELQTINTINIIEKEQIHEDIGTQINPIYSYNVSNEVIVQKKIYSYNILNI